LHLFFILSTPFLTNLVYICFPSIEYPMGKKHLIQKTSGNMELYSREKLEASLRRSGADDATIETILSDIEAALFEGMSSRKIYDKAFALLRKSKLGQAARYRLKKAMMEMGPTGYPFEFFVGEVFRIMGYKIEVGQVLQGHCVTHEVDVIATRGNQQHFVECKYYQSTGKNANVQVPMYIRSRVDDLVHFRKDLPQYKGFQFQGWVVTNTRFTGDAISFGECTGLNLLSWDYPVGKGLKEFVDRHQLFPVTVLTRLLNAEKHQLMDNGHVLCRQLFDQPSILASLGMDEVRQRKVLEEIRLLCTEP
jgi:hypothetical protein